MKALTHWSYSAYSAWKECAFRFLVTRIKKKIVEPMGWPIRQGIELHLKAEHYLKGNVTVLPPQLQSFTQQYRTLRRMGPTVEKFWGVDEQWNFRKRNAWAVMKMDSAVPPGKDGMLLIQDLKTGNWYPGHFDQGELYATIGLAKYPKARAVDVEFWYPKTGSVERWEFAAGKAQARRVEKWTERGRALLNPKQKYLPSPSPHACKWCHVSSAKGGPCEAWKSLRSASS